MPKPSSVTRDSIALRGAGVVQIAQPVKGHRFTLDSILLADFCRIGPREHVLEPGAGTGIISLLLARKHPHSLFSPVEIQANLHSLCEENRRTNGLDNVTPVHGDMQKLSTGHRYFDVIVANPPYIRSGTGRASPIAGRKAARQDLLGCIELWLDLRKFLKQGGRYNVVFPAARLAELVSLMRSRKLEPKRLRLVHPYADRPASLALVEAVQNGGNGMEVLAPLIVHEADGEYTSEMKNIYDLSADR